MFCMFSYLFSHTDLICEWNKCAELLWSTYVTKPYAPWINWKIFLLFIIEVTRMIELLQLEVSPAFPVTSSSALFVCQTQKPSVYSYSKPLTVYKDGQHDRWVCGRELHIVSPLPIGCFTDCGTKWHHQDGSVWEEVAAHHPSVFMSVQENN